MDVWEFVGYCFRLGSLHLEQVKFKVLFNLFEKLQLSKYDTKIYTIVIKLY